MSPRRIARRQVGIKHAESVERNARLLAASSGDGEHADRIGSVLDDLAANSRPPAPVISLPARPYDREAVFACEDDESAGLAGELRPRANPFVAWLVAVLFALGVWVVLAALAFGFYELAVAL